MLLRLLQAVSINSPSSSYNQLSFILQFLPESLEQRPPFLLRSQQLFKQNTKGLGNELGNKGLTVDF